MRTNRKRKIFKRIIKINVDKLERFIVILRQAINNGLDLLNLYPNNKTEFKRCIVIKLSTLISCNALQNIKRNLNGGIYNDKQYDKKASN